MKRKISVKIQSKDELKRVLQTEASVYEYKWYYRLPWNLTENQILYKHARYLRLAEYAFNTHRWNRHYYLLRLLRIQTRYALSIPLNVLGEGFSIAHLGTVIINAGSTVGRTAGFIPEYASVQTEENRRESAITFIWDREQRCLEILSLRMESWWEQMPS